MKQILLVLLLAVCSHPLWGQAGFTQEGKASFYADKFEGRVTASGERYSHARSTCAHLSLPFGSLVRVTNTANNLSVVCRVNDRGPFVPNRIIDLSRSAAEKLNFIDAGIADVRIEVIQEANAIIAPSAAAPVPAPSPSPSPSPAPAPSPAPVSSPPPVSKEQAPPPKPTPAPAKPIATAQTEQVELYQVIVDRIEPKGFTIQIGSYKELVNLLRIADDLKKSLKKEVRVQVATMNGEKVYRLMVGAFNTREEAERFRIRAATIYPDCFVVELK